VTVEFLGTALLVATIVGSGIMADELSADDGVSLLGNTVATLGMLFVLITIFGKVSGAHFNPVVSLAFCLRREMEILSCLAFTVAQCLGAIAGCVAANGMFDQSAAAFDGKDRHKISMIFAESVATFGLLLTIFGCLGTGQKKEIPLAVALYITAGYWFTSSTAFANPAVTLGRCFTSTFASINPTSYGHYLGGQLFGFAVAMPFLSWLFGGVDARDALGVLLRRPINHASADTAAADALKLACVPLSGVPLSDANKGAGYVPAPATCH
jgi:glycerol uptake facilitator-like aquaporin